MHNHMRIYTYIVTDTLLVSECYPKNADWDHVSQYLIG